MSVFRCYVEKREEFAIEANALLLDLRDFLGITGLETVRVLCRYDVEGVTESLYRSALSTIFSEPQTDECYNEALPYTDGPDGRHRVLAVESLPGQYDQRADSCVQCIKLLATTGAASAVTLDNQLAVRTAKVYILCGEVTDGDMDRLRSYLINPVDSREATYDKPETLAVSYTEPPPEERLSGFVSVSDDELLGYLDSHALAMDPADILFMRSYFRDTEKRDPTLTELRVIDTYWSDHCRHTTFNTHITDITIEDPQVKSAYDAYIEARREVYGSAAETRPQTLMDVATIAAKVLRGRGLLSNIDLSEEVNACSIHVNADVDGSPEDWLLSFKNETHNHPTEVEPFGGAATCIGGAIRDPLSGRAYVYQAMRISGAGDPRVPIGDTLPGKIPQKKLTVTAARGYSSYANQIGLAAGLVHELYNPGYIAKRMELGAVVGAVRADRVVRETPAPGDKVLLLGGRTGRDGIGGATGSSKSHNEDSLVTMASEVQKGNAPEERKIQRLFLDPEVTKLIKRCNDFGAGGVAVAVGELADGLDVDLTLVRRKYEGMDGTETAISESQERMAVVVAPRDVGTFIEKADKENLEAYVIAEVTGAARMVMRNEGRVIVDLSRDFLSTNGAEKRTSVTVPAPMTNDPYPGLTVPQQQVKPCSMTNDPYPELAVPQQQTEPCSVSVRFRALVSDIRFCSQSGLHAMFDGSVGASSVLMKSGGKTQSTPTQVMAALLPVGFSEPACVSETSTCSVMSFGFDPYASSCDPFTAAKTAVVTSVAKLVAAGCDPDAVYLTFQEYFENLRDDPVRWGKPFAALLGAFEAQMELGLAAIGGKDSMSGSFREISVPPTLVSFAIAPNDAKYVITPELKKSGNEVVIFRSCADLASTKEVWRRVRKLIVDGAIISAWAVTEGGVAEGIFKMALGNEVGFELSEDTSPEILFENTRGAIIAEVTRSVPESVTIGRTVAEPVIIAGGCTLDISELKALWESGLDDVFPIRAGQTGAVPKISYNTRSVTVANERFAKPRALIFSFPGTNSEIDTARAVSRAGGVPRVFVVRNLTQAMLEDSINEARRAIKESQIIILPGGFSFGDEPDGSAKFIAAFFRSHSTADAVHEHLNQRGGLILGICNGFQALIKLGLVPYGEITPAGSRAESPTLTHNMIGRHQAGYVYTRVASVNSPWMSLSSVGDVHAVAISHGEGRFVAPDELLVRLAADGRVATQYTDRMGEPSMDSLVNPNGSIMAVEGLFSPDGRVFGKMGHTERRGEFVAKNIYGNKHQPVFESGIYYFN